MMTGPISEQEFDITDYQLAAELAAGVCRRLTAEFSRLAELSAKAAAPHHNDIGCDPR